MVQQQIDCGCVTWGHSGHSLLMKQCARVICYVYGLRHISIVTLFRTLGWQPSDVRIQYFTSIVIYNVMHRDVPGYLTGLIVLNNTVSYFVRVMFAFGR